MTARAGINGFGRFGLHLLRYWLDRRDRSPYSIAFINDDTLSLDQAYTILTTDRYVRFDDVRLTRTPSALVIHTRDGAELEIPYTHEPAEAIPWLGQPDLLFECSGKRTKAPTCAPFMRGRTQHVLISATSWDADTTLVYGFNHETFDPKAHKTVSYGSCTVNGYVPLASYLHQRFGVRDSDVNVVHNIPEYKLAGHDTLLRKFCTLERSGPQLLGFIDPDKNFVVNYSVVPWTGVSMLDFRFRLERPVDEATARADLEAAVTDGPLAGLYAIDEADVGPAAHVCTPYSAVFIRRGIKMRGGSLYIQSYFDTENSVNRYHDLASYIARKVV